MIGEPVRWSDEVDEVIRGDLAAAVAYITLAGGAVVTAVCPAGIGRREAGEVGFHTSPGFPMKLERIIADPHVTPAQSDPRARVFGQPGVRAGAGLASVDIRPSRERIEAFIPTRNATQDTSSATRYGTGCYASTTSSGSSWTPPCSASSPGRPERLRSPAGIRRSLARCCASTGAPEERHRPEGGRGPGRRVDRRPWPRLLAYREPPASRWWCRWNSPAMTRRACGWSCPAGCSLSAAAARAYSPTPTARSAERPFRRLYDSQPTEQATVHIGGSASASVVCASGAEHKGQPHQYQPGQYGPRLRNLGPGLTLRLAGCISGSDRG
jgi:hypothetical protein